jgi:hypothetical protein
MKTRVGIFARWLAVNAERGWTSYATGANPGRISVITQASYIITRMKTSSCLPRTGVISSGMERNLGALHRREFLTFRLYFDGFHFL